MVPTPIAFTITGIEALPGSHQIVGWCFPPTSASSSFPTPVWMFLCPGGGEERHYFHLEVEGYAADAYSFASFYASRGIGVVVIDLPGTGESRWGCDGSLLTLDLVAQANHQAVCQMRERLRQGTLVGQIPAIEQVVVAGFGHSNGGGVSIVQQAIYKSFDLLGNLGAPCGTPSRPRDLETMTNLFHIERGYATINLNAVATPLLYMEDVPLAVRQTYESYITIAPLPIHLLSLLQPGTLAQYAQNVDVPILLVFGERDISSAPRQEPQFYTSTRDCTLYEQPRAAHHHNLASTRHELWMYIYNWLWAVHPARILASYTRRS